MREFNGILNEFFGDGPQFYEREIQAEEVEALADLGDNLEDQIMLPPTAETRCSERKYVMKQFGKCFLGYFIVFIILAWGT